MTERALRAGGLTPDEVAAEWPTGGVPLGVGSPTQTV